MSVLATASVKHPSSTSNNIVLTNTGRVGIGTESPSTNLHVVGEVTLASQVRFGAGSVSTPSISTSGDTNTGLFFPAADTLALVEGGTEVLRITSDGRVGIGTTSPNTKLEVDGVVRARAVDGEGGQIDLNNPDNASQGAFLDVVSADVTRWFTVRNNSQHQIGQLVGTGGIVTLHTAANERMRITAAGDVGIGTTTPSFGSGSGVDIERAGISTLRLDDTADGTAIEIKAAVGAVAIDGRTNHPMLLATNGVERMRIGSTGNIGIGTTTFNGRLTVDGGGAAAWFMGTGAVFQGIALQNRFASASQYAVNFIDFRNELGIPLGHVFCEMGTDGGSALIFGSTVPGLRSSDRRNEGLRIGPSTVASALPIDLNSTYLYHAWWRGALDRAWDNYPSISIYNHTDRGPQGEFRIHGLGGANGGDFSIVTRSDGGFVSGSDSRRKTNIQAIANPLDRVLAIAGKQYQVVNKDGEVEDGLSHSGKKIGFIGQEIIEVLPEVVKFYPEADTPTESGWASAYSIDYGSITALIVEAIKELNNKIIELETKI